MAPAVWLPLACRLTTLLLLASSSGAVQVDGDWACPLEKWSLEERHNRSQVVFTAVVESCLNSASQLHNSVDDNNGDDDIDDASASDQQQELCQRSLSQQSAAAETGEPHLALVVRVKKVFKGLDRHWEGRLVSVDGLRDPRLCPSRVRLRDTRIFLASYAAHQSGAGDSVDGPRQAGVRLRLNSSLVAVSLRHLQQLRALTKGTTTLEYQHHRPAHTD